MPSCFDAAWRRRALRAEPEAVQALADHALEPLFRFCLYRLDGDRESAEEVVQATLTEALHDLTTYDPTRCDGEIMGWLTGLARNQIRRLHHHRSRHRSLDELWQHLDASLLDAFARIEESLLASQVFDREEVQALVATTLSQIPDGYRRVLEGKYLDDLSVRDLAGRLATTEKAVESMLTRARAAFREAFLTLSRNLTGV